MTNPALDTLHEPTDDEMILSLDAYGHMTWVVGNEDWMACGDFKVYILAERGIVIAYHVVVDCETGGFIDTMESGVFSYKDLGDLENIRWFPLAQYADICAEHYIDNDDYDPPDDDEVAEVEKSWVTEVETQVKRAMDALASGEELPLTFMEDS